MTAPSWTLETPATSGALLLRFVGPTQPAEMPELLAAMTLRLPKSAAHLIFDIRDLEGHDSDVRAAFQDWLMQHRSRIARVTVVVRKAASLFKVAASVVRFATGLDVQVRDDLESDAAVAHIVD